MNNYKDPTVQHIKGQSTVEYILLVTAVIAVIILFTTGNNGPFRTQLTNVLATTSADMVNVANRLSQ